MNTLIQQAAQVISQADALIITAGAGMSIDSGLPDFRGKNGFWNAFPPLAHLGKSFVQMATPNLFEKQPALAWGFYGWRLNSYRQTEPHQGFQILKKWAEQKPHGAFVFTSNVDGHFQKAGFPNHRVIACHGSIHTLQCLHNCQRTLWSADDFHPEVDEQTCLLQNEPPRCPNCGGLARPNILMFGDWNWIDSDTALREAQFETWRKQIQNAVIIELGAGTAIPTVRRFSQLTARELDATLIRINPDESQSDYPKHIALSMGALEALEQIDKCLLV